MPPTVTNPDAKNHLHLQVFLAFAIFAFLLFLGLTSDRATLTDEQKKSASAAVVLGTGTTYYVSSSMGDDSNNGLTSDSPIQTLAKASSLPNLTAGDNILLKRGDTFTGKLVISKSGSPTARITIADYDSGELPIIDGSGVTDFGIYSDGQNYVTITNIDVRNQSGSTNPSTGVGLVNTNNFLLDGIKVSNVTGLAGIYIYSNVPGRSQNNVIENSTVTNTKASPFAASSNNFGNGIQLWGECDTCGAGNIIKNSTSNNNNGVGIAIFMKNSTVTGNTVSGNGVHGIAAGNILGTNTVVDGNTVSGNCQKRDDCSGIDFFRTGGNNSIRNNTLTGQHNTIADSSIAANPFPGFKVGTIGIRFDGGSKDLFDKPGLGDYMDQAGNVVSNNQIQNEYDGIQVFNYNNIALTANKITSIDSSRSTIWAGSDNVENKTIAAYANDNILSGPKGIVTSKATIVGNNASSGTSTTITPSPDPILPPPPTCTPTTYYLDKDKDGFGDPTKATSTCSQPTDYVINKKDCNDNYGARYSTKTCPSRNSNYYRTK